MLFALGDQPVDDLPAYAAGAGGGVYVEVLQVAHGGELAGVFVGKVVGYADDVLLAAGGGVHGGYGVHAAVGGCCAALLRGVDALPQVGGDGGVGLALIKAGVGVPQGLPAGVVLRREFAQGGGGCLGCHGFAC